MEQISKKEYYEQYANQRDKRNIRWAAILAYVCAAISLALGILLKNYSILIDVVLIVGLALGVQIAKSRVCAVLLLVYSSINTLFSLISTGQVAGWWLIVVGIWAVVGTFNFHKDYQKYLSETKSQNINS